MGQIVEENRDGTGRAGVVIVAGSGSGCGRLTARALACRGYAVLATMRALEGENVAAIVALADWAARERLALQPVELDPIDDASVECAVGHVLAAARRFDDHRHSDWLWRPQSCALDPGRNRVAAS